MPENPHITEELRQQMADVIGTAVTSYLSEFTSRLFPDHATSAAQDCVVDGIAIGIARYQSTTGLPIAKAVALALLEVQ